MLADAGRPTVVGRPSFVFIGFQGWWALTAVVLYLDHGVWTGAATWAHPDCTSSDSNNSSWRRELMAMRMSWPTAHNVAYAQLLITSVIFPLVNVARTSRQSRSVQIRPPLRLWIYFSKTLLCILVVTRELSTPTTGGVHPSKTFLTPQHRPPLEVLRVLTRTLIGSMLFSATAVAY